MPRSESERNQESTEAAQELEPEEDLRARLREVAAEAATRKIDKMLVILVLLTSFLSILYLTAPSIRFVLIQQLKDTLRRWF